MRKNHNLHVEGASISVSKIGKDDYICLTDIAKAKEGNSRASDIIKNWIRNRGTLEFIGTWEQLNNPSFKVVEFDHFKMQAGLPSFVLSPGQWIEQTNAIGIVVKSGRYGGTFAHKDIAFEFCSAISPIFKLYLIKEFQRLKDNEQKELGWNIRRNLTKINYRVHTDAVKANLIPTTLKQQQISFIYATEADVLNIALFGKTAKQWREENPKLKGNIRDYANVAQLVCLSNLENLNAHFIKEGIAQNERLVKLNTIAIEQMKLLISDTNIISIEDNF